jgi:hypothetical protein
MMSKLPDLTVKHRKIDKPESTIWNLTRFIYIGGTKMNSHRVNFLDELSQLPLKSETFISIVEQCKAHAESKLDSGASQKTIGCQLTNLKAFVGYADEHRKQLDSVESIRKTLFAYAEHQFTRGTLRQIKPNSAYVVVAGCALFLNGAYEDLQFEINQTRIKIGKQSRRALSRNAEKIKLSDAAKLANFCCEIAQNFDPALLTSGSVPILVTANKQEVNLTSIGGRIYTQSISKDFTQNSAYQAFNARVAAEVLIFLAMTLQNQAPTYLLKRVKFDYKPLDEKYQVREFKARRGGEVLFTIPKPYMPYFEGYLAFLESFAPDSGWLFPHLMKGKGFRKRTDSDTSKLHNLCERYNVPWVSPNNFRSIGENLLMRMASNANTAADYAGHAVATFRQSYEFPSLQRAMIQIGQFWDENDPLTHGKPTVSLFNSPCNGNPTPIEDATNKLPKPDCINPTGCIGCINFRDDDSFDYVWNLHSFRYLEIIASSSHRTKETKAANIAIDWVNLKINWFKTSKSAKRRKWVEEAQMRIEEGEYHLNWSRKIHKFEG